MSLFVSRPQIRIVRYVAMLGLVVFVTVGMDGSCGNTQGNNNNSTGQKPEIDESRDHILVAAGAEPSITVVEYGDLQCPACGNFARNHYDRLISEYVETGKIRFVFRHYPLNGHAQALPAAEAAECIANQDESRFFEFVEAVYAAQSDLFDNESETAAELRELAGTLGFDLDDYDGCLAGNSEINRIEEDRTSGTALGLQVTPTFFVEDVRIGRPGTLQQTVDDLFGTLDEMLGE